MADKRAILEDQSIQFVVSATIPDIRAATAIEVMRHGKDIMVDKPGVITLDELAAVRKVQPWGGFSRSVFPNASRTGPPRKPASWLLPAPSAALCRQSD